MLSQQEGGRFEKRQKQACFAVKRASLRSRQMVGGILALAMMAAPSAVEAQYINPHRNLPHMHKGQIHCHSTRSWDDFAADHTPEEQLEDYKARGFDVVALTDHFEMQNDDREKGGFGTAAYRETLLTDPGVDGVLYLPSFERGVFEFSDGLVHHLLGLGVTGVPSTFNEIEGNREQTCISEVGQLGGLAVIAHPRLDDEADKGGDWPLSELQALTGYTGIDICRRKKQWESEYRGAFTAWLQLIQAGKCDVWALSGDDCHANKYRGHGWIVVNSKEPGPLRSDILSNLRAGNVFAYANWEQSVATVPEFEEVKVVVDQATSRPRVQVRATGDEPSVRYWRVSKDAIDQVDYGSLRDYTSVGKEDYVVVELRNGEHCSAFSQPLWMTPKFFTGPPTATMDFNNCIVKARVNTSPFQDVNPSVVFWVARELSASITYQSVGDREVEVTVAIPLEKLDAYDGVVKVMAKVWDANAAGIDSLVLTDLPVVAIRQAMAPVRVTEETPDYFRTASGRAFAKRAGVSIPNRTPAGSGTSPQDMARRTGVKKPGTPGTGSLDSPVFPDGAGGDYNTMLGVFVGRGTYIGPVDFSRVLDLSWSLSGGFRDVEVQTYGGQGCVTVKKGKTLLDTVLIAYRPKREHGRGFAGDHCDLEAKFGVPARGQVASKSLSLSGLIPRPAVAIEEVIRVEPITQESDELVTTSSGQRVAKKTATPRFSSGEGPVKDKGRSVLKTKGPLHKQPGTPGRPSGLPTTDIAPGPHPASSLVKVNPDSNAVAVYVCQVSGLPSSARAGRVEWWQKNPGRISHELYPRRTVRRQDGVILDTVAVIYRLKASADATGPCTLAVDYRDVTGVVSGMDMRQLPVPGDWLELQGQPPPVITLPGKILTPGKRPLPDAKGQKKVRKLPAKPGRN